MRRIALALGAAAVALVAAAAPAAAHVTIEPPSAPRGSDAVLTIVVPNEKRPQTTTQVVVRFPTDHPIADALVEPLAGWTAQVEDFSVTTPIHTDSGDVTTAVRSVTWTAQGAGIPVGHFEEFRVSVGLPDDADSLAFPTTQTYSDGSVVSWTQVALPNAPEPDNPQPVLTLTAPGSAAPATGAASGTTPGASRSDVDTARTLGIVGIVVGALGLVAAAGALLAARRRGAASASAP